MDAILTFAILGAGLIAFLGLIVLLFVEVERTRFQFHLSTAIVLMLVASGVIWLNVAGEKGDLIVSDDYTLAKGWKLTKVNHIYGWPFTFKEYETQEVLKKWNNNPDWLEGLHDIPVLIFNVFCWVVILIGSVVLCERRIRRDKHQPVFFTTNPVYYVFRLGGLGCLGILLLICVVCTLLVVVQEAKLNPASLGVPCLTCLLIVIVLRAQPKKPEPESKKPDPQPQPDTPVQEDKH